MNRIEASSSFSPLTLVKRVVESTQMSRGMLKIRVSVMELGRFTAQRRPDTPALFRLCSSGWCEAMERGWIDEALPWGCAMIPWKSDAEGGGATQSYLRHSGLFALCPALKRRAISSRPLRGLNLNRWSKILP